MDLDRSDNVILKAANQYGQMCQKGDLKNDFIIREGEKKPGSLGPKFFLLQDSMLLKQGC